MAECFVGSCWRLGCCGAGLPGAHLGGVQGLGGQRRPWSSVRCFGDVSGALRHGPADTETQGLHGVVEGVAGHFWGASRASCGAVQA